MPLISRYCPATTGMYQYEACMILYRLLFAFLCLVARCADPIPSVIMKTV